MLQILFHLLSCVDGKYILFRRDLLLIYRISYMQFTYSYKQYVLLAIYISLEAIWNLRLGKKKGIPKAERIKYLLPDSMWNKMKETGGSPYPYLRLLLPDHDSARPHTGMKESKVAETWAKALGCNKGHKIHTLLTGYRNGKLIGSDPITKANANNSIGDLSCVLMDIMKYRAPGSGSKLTVGEMNEWLDVLVDVVKDRFDMPTEEPTEKSKWRKSLEKAIRSGPLGAKKGKGDIYRDLVEKLIHKNLSVSHMAN